MSIYTNIVNKFYGERYDYLLMCASNILKLIKRQDLKYDLVTLTYEYIIKNEEKLKDMVVLSGMIESIAVNHSTMQIKWSNTAFKKQFIYSDKHLTIATADDMLNYTNNTPDESISEEDYLQQEKEIQDKLAHIIMHMHNETLANKMLYDAIFIKGINSSNKLAKHTKLSRAGAYKMMKRFKNRIKDGYTGPNHNNQ